jgi:adenosine deaminase
VDLAGPNRKNFSMQKHAELFALARKAGLGITVHTGEEAQLAEMRYVVREIKPDRIGHGIQCHKDKALMAEVVKNNITLEICPTSNLRNSVMKNVAEMKKALELLVKNKVKFTINTDGPEMYKSNILDEQEFLLKNRILNFQQIVQATAWAQEASFIK